MLGNLCANTIQCNVGARSVAILPGIMTKSARFCYVLTTNVLVRCPYLHCKTDSKINSFLWLYLSTNGWSMIRAWWLHNYFSNYLWRYYVIVFSELLTKSFHIFCIQGPFKPSLLSNLAGSEKASIYFICFCDSLWTRCRIAKTRFWNCSRDQCRLRKYIDWAHSSVEWCRVRCAACSVYAFTRTTSWATSPSMVLVCGFQTHFRIGSLCILLYWTVWIQTRIDLFFCVIVNKYLRSRFFLIFAPGKRHTCKYNEWMH